MQIMVFDFFFSEHIYAGSQEEFNLDTYKRMKNYLHQSAREEKLELLKLKILCRFY